MTYGDYGTILILFILIYFLFNLGIKLANNQYYETFFPWAITLFSLLLGYTRVTNTQDPVGFIGFIPILTYIYMKILSSMNFSMNTERKLKASFVAGVAGAINYFITHELFNFGIPNPDIITAIAAAAIIGGITYVA